MSKVTMPEPTAWMLAIQTMGGNIGWKLSWSQSGAGVCTRLTGESNEKSLVTTDQAEVYAQARVNEALEEAIDKVAMHGGSVEIEAAIRALKTKG